jgi:HEAT repeat protein
MTDTSDSAAAPDSRNDMEQAAAGSPNMDQLLDDLGADELATRRQARAKLVAMGEAALPALLEGLQKGSFPIRWEAAKALGQIGHPGAVPGLLAALRDSEQDVRWLAAVGLAAIGRPAIPPLLRLLISDHSDALVRQGVHHVLAIFDDPEWEEPLAHIRDILNPVEVTGAVVPAAEKALRKLEG